MGKISNITNSTEPQSIVSRIFVGNLNTFVITKEDVEGIFKRYGKIVGISMHKGYAFIQYSTESEARAAVLGEDQRVYAAQPIDANMAAEPKPNRPSRKRPQGSGAEWDYYYNVRVSSNSLPTPISSPIFKRPCPDMTSPHTVLVNTFPLSPIVGQRPLISLSGSALVPTSGRLSSMPRLKPIITSGAVRTEVAGTMNVTGNSVGKRPDSWKHSVDNTVDDQDSGVGDILICGKCRRLFFAIDSLIDHKRTKCRPICNCVYENSSNGDAPASSTKGVGQPSSLTCAVCQKHCSSAWELCVHCQIDHELRLYSEDFVGSSSSVSEMSTTESDGVMDVDGVDGSVPGQRLTRTDVSVAVTSVAN